MIKQYIDKYYVSDRGVVYNNDSGRELSLDNSNGYSRVRLSIGNVKKKYSVHRMVAECFIDRIDGKDFVNHKNGIKTDNRVENLEWVNNQENMVHAKDVLLVHFINDCSPKAVVCDNGNTYYSIKQTASGEGIATKTVRNRIRIGRYKYV